MYTIVQMQPPRKYIGRFRYGRKDVTFHFWAVLAEVTPPDTVIFLGAGQVGKIPKWVAAAAGDGVVVVEGLPHWMAAPDDEDVKRFTVTYVRHAMKIVLDTFDVTSMHLLAESQAAPASIILAYLKPDRVRNLVLIKPLGFTVQAFGRSERERMRVFRRRIIRTAVQLPQSFFHDPRNAAVTSIMARAMMREPSAAALIKKYAIGISYDVSDDCRKVASLQRRKGHSFTIVLGERDKIFPPAEVAEALARAKLGKDIVVEVVPGVSHSSLAVRASKSLLKRAVAIARQARRR